MRCRDLLVVNSKNEHIVQFYESHEYLCDAVSLFIRSGLDRGQAVIVIATPEHRRGFEDRLSVPRREDQLMLLDADETLSRFMVDDRPDWNRFNAVVGGAISKASERHDGVRAYGEMVNLLWERGNLDATLQLEQMWNDLAKSHSFSLLCAYRLGNFDQAAHQGPLSRVCGTHTHVIPSESYTKIENLEESLRLIAHLQQKAKALETAVHARDEFISMASHELRTPLSALMLHLQGALQSYRKEEGSEIARVDVLQRLEKLETHARRLSRLIDELLDVSRMSAGKFVLERESMELSHVVRQVIERWGHPVEFQSDMVWGNWDPLRIEQVATNLIGNAIKYGEGRPVRVHVSNLGSRARLQVEDQGIGMSAEFMTRIFKPFERGVSPRNHGGLGLGLYICRRIVESHGGTIAVSSAPGVGSIFTVELPL